MKKVQWTFDSGARARFSEPRDMYRVKKLIIINFFEFIEVARTSLWFIIIRNYHKNNVPCQTLSCCPVVSEIRVFLLQEFPISSLLKIPQLLNNLRPTRPDFNKS